MRILLVCLGNICRSPTAEAALREALAEAGMADRVEVDSAGTGDWHLGHPPDRRMTEAAATAGLTLAGTARLLEEADFTAADLILVMDRANLRDVRALAPDEATRAKVRLFREFEASADGDEVPDPYGGDPQGYARVAVIARASARGVVEHLRARGA
ncbi:MAG: low molecular weight phosphotyrosine protein phosphatase [Euzebyales bacterium]|nr:low molecular weight phosphotyrosine protein phosphatase [Euzebyales bacterium]MBA3622720.1 low molecular weight phosphotyrosine protein phosphatase [Euzebyales bacterium]